MRAPRSRRGCAARRSFRARNSWIGGRALPSHKSRAGNNRRDERGLTGCDAFARSRSPGVASTGAAHAVPGVFEMGVFEMRCSAAARKSASTTTEAVTALRRSHWSAPVCHRAPPKPFRDAARATRTPEPATIERAQCRLHRPRQIERLASTMAGRAACSDRAQIPGLTAPGWGADLIPCGGQTGRRFAAELR